MTLRSLFWLRHCSVLAQLVTMVVADRLLGYPVPWPTVTVVLLATAAFNFYTGWWLRRATPLRGWRLYLQFGFDVLQLATVLYFTGAGQNPFVSLLLLPVALALLTGEARLTVSVLLLAVLAYLALLVWPPAFHWHVGHDEMMSLHLYGMWINFVVTALAMAGFGLQLLRRQREHEHAIAEARERALRDERLIALGTQAAQIAHQFGTPLNTALLLSDELRRASKADMPALLDELDRAMQQCRDWLDSLRTLSESDTEQPLAMLVADTLEQWRWFRPQANLQVDISALAGLKQTVPQSLAPALLNLVNNAWEASQRNGSDYVGLRASAELSVVSLYIEDAGTGFAKHNELMQVSDGATHNPAHPAAEPGPTVAGRRSPQATGLGIGIQLANASIERLGGEVSWQQTKSGGTLTTVRLPLHAPI